MRLGTTDPSGAATIRRLMLQLDHHRAGDLILTLVSGIHVAADGSVDQASPEYQQAISTLQQIARATNPRDEAVGLGLIRSATDLYLVETLGRSSANWRGNWRCLQRNLGRRMPSLCEAVEFFSNFARHASNATTGGWKHKATTGGKAFVTLLEDVANFAIAVFVPIAKTIAVVLAIGLLVLGIALVVIFWHWSRDVPVVLVAVSAANGSSGSRWCLRRLPASVFLCCARLRKHSTQRGFTR